MGQSFPVAGRKIYLGGLFVPPTSGRLLTVEDFPAITANTWISIGKWQSSGNLGGDQATITTPYLNEDYDEVQMGTKNPGTMQNTFGVLDDDPGQIALYAAAGDKRLRSFLVEFPDAPVGAAAHGSIRLFAAYVKQPNEQGGEANTAGMMTSELVKFRNIVKVAAAASGGPVAGGGE